MIRLAIVILIFLLSCPVYADVHEAATCSRSDVQAAIDASSDGDTVLIPPGECTWTQTVKVGEQTGWNPPVFNTKGITIKGAGSDRTIITDNVTKTDQGPPNYTTPQVFYIYTKPGVFTRLTGMKIDNGTGDADPYNKGIVVIGGNGNHWRVDHMYFKTTREPAFQIYCDSGLIDNCYFELGAWKFAVYSHNGGDVYGDLSWAQDSPVGTNVPMFIEDCTFTSTNWNFAIDGWTGCRVVFRHNTCTNVGLGNHGSESPGRYRGARSLEIYENSITVNDPAFISYPIGYRSGTGVIFNNTIVGQYLEETAIVLSHYRDLYPFSPWGYSDGTGVYDVNDGVTYDTGTHTGTHQDPVADMLVLTDSTKSWTPDQWYGYSVLNTTTGASGVILDNDATTITCRVSNAWGPPNMDWDNGDAYSIKRTTICLDQCGRGKGNLLSGDTPEPTGWPNQELDPVYAWSNTLNGSGSGIESNSPHVVENRDFYNGTQRPGYTAYTYPHPSQQEPGAELVGAGSITGGGLGTMTK